jgi:DNA-binding PadR family transcriptional regulator
MSSAVRKPRLDAATKQVLTHLLASPEVETYGLAICKAIGRPTGTVHPILYRFEDRGWLTSRVEDIDPVTTGRPRRRYYQFTEFGRQELSELLPEGTA